MGETGSDGAVLERFALEFTRTSHELKTDAQFTCGPQKKKKKEHKNRTVIFSFAIVPDVL